MPRNLLLGLLLALVGVAFAAPATAGLEIRRVDLGSYPQVRVLVVVPPGSESAPVLRVQGSAAAGFSAENLGDQQGVALVIDRSQSMHGATLRDAIRAAEVLIAAKPAPDQISVITAGSEAVSQAGFSSQASDADAALTGLGVDPVRGTVLWDAVVLAAKSLRALGLPGRTVIMVTDGQETTSRATLDDAIAAAKAAGAAVYTVGIPDVTFDPGPLRRLAAETGGRFYRASSSAALPGIYSAIGAELRRTWRLEFDTAARPGDMLNLDVRDGGERAASSVRIPGSGSRSGGGSSFVLLSVASLLALVAVVGVMLVVRSSTLLHGWSRRSPDEF